VRHWRVWRFQTRDLIEAMQADWASDANTVLRVDGGMVAQRLDHAVSGGHAGRTVDRPVVLETTALGRRIGRSRGRGLPGAG